MERGSSNALNANSVKDTGKSEDLKSGASCSAEVIVDQWIDVMFICSEWGSSKGGLSTFNREIAVNLAKYSKERIKVHCFVCQNTEEERQDASSNGIHLITARRPPGSRDSLEWIRIPPPELRNPNIVVSHRSKFGGAAYSIQQITGCKWIHFVHVFCEDLGKFKLECNVTADAIADNEEKNKRELELCKASNLVVAVGSLLQRKYQRNLPDFKVEVITPGIFEKFVNPTTRPREWMKFESSGEDEFRIFIFGRGSFEDFELKGYDIIGKAVASLERRFELTFVGAPQDQQRKIEKWFLEETKITRNQLTIKGFCNYKETREIFRQADAVVMPSRTEGFGLVALEAISAGVPLLVSRECGIAKALQTVDGGMAVVIPSASPEEWANRIQELSQQSPDERYASAVRLRENYGKRYHWKEESEKFMKMILQLAPNPSPEETVITGKVPCSSNNKEQTQRKEVLTAKGNLLHGLEFKKRDGREQSESAPAARSHDEASEINPKKSATALKVTLLGSEWSSSMGGLSTINRQLAMVLAKHPEVDITLLVSNFACSEEEKRMASSHNVTILEAEILEGFSDPLEWLSFPPRDLDIDFVLGHGVKLGKQAQIIRKSHGCKWIQVVHTEPEELAMYKNYPKAISKGQEENLTEVALCKLADAVLAVGPKLRKAYYSYLHSCEKHQDIIQLTPSTFREFSDVKQAAVDMGNFKILTFGRGDPEDFSLKGYDISARAIVELEDRSYHLIFVGAPYGKQDEVAKNLLKSGIDKKQLTVRNFVHSEERLKELFCEVDLCIMPSRTEGFGLTALEAFSTGLPILVSRNSGFGEALCTVPSGKSFVVESEDPEEWAKAIAGVRQKKRSDRLQDIQQLRSSYEEKFSWEKQCDSLVGKMWDIVHASERRDTSSKAGQLEVIDMSTKQSTVDSLLSPR